MREDLSLLNQISDELNKDLDPDKMLRRVLDLTVAHFAASTGSIMLFDRDNRVTDFILQQEDVSGDRAKHIVGTVLTEGFAGWMLSHGGGGIIHDTYTDSRWVVYDNQPYDVRAVIGMPLRRRHLIIGILTLVHDEPYRFKEDSLSLLNAIAGQAAIALENARLFKQTEQERHKLSAIIDHTQDGVLLTKPNNRIMLINPAAQEMLEIDEGYPLLDQPINELSENAELLKMLAPDTQHTGEVTMRDGRVMWATVTEINDLGRITVLRDVSAYKELDRMKREFVNAFTHDLRTPLATVKGYIDLVRMDGPVNERQEEDLIGIDRAAHSMRSLVEDLLQLSKLEQLDQITRETVDLDDVVQSSVGYMRSAAKAKSIDLITIDSSPDMVVEGNAVLLTRAVSNLIDNAIKYTPRSGKVRVQLTENQSRAQISVQDNGPGISAKDLPRVFEKFFRARAEIDELVPGTGLGLSIVKTIVVHHSGKVWVESKPNVGSLFTISLPLIANQNGHR